jgi:hypothetical protein
LADVPTLIQHEPPELLRGLIFHSTSSSLGDDLASLNSRVDTGSIRRPWGSYTHHKPQLLPLQLLPLPHRSRHGDALCG